MGDIQSHEFFEKDGGWWIGMSWVSISGDYEDAVCESLLENVYTDEPEALIAYAQNLGKSCEKDFAEAIAKVAQKTVASLFPEVVPEGVPEVAQVVPKVSQPPPVPRTVLRDTTNKSNRQISAPVDKAFLPKPRSTVTEKENAAPGTTTVNHANKTDGENICGEHTYNETDYEKEEVPYYWLDEKKQFFGKPCKICHVPIGKQESNNGPERTMIKPTTKTPVFVCKKLALGHSKCDHIICNRCWQEGISKLGSTSGPTHRRRGQQQGDGI